jgi:hypothetical protein
VAGVDWDDPVRPLLSAHLAQFESARRALAPDPGPVDYEEIEGRCLAAELSGVGFFDRAGRRAAKERAVSQAAAQVQAEGARRASEHKAVQEELDEQWDKLCRNEPEAITQALGVAFQRRKLSAAPLEVQGAGVFLLIRFGTTDVIPDRKPDFTPTGLPTTRKRTKAEINDVYAQALASAVLAAVRETFAVAPSIAEVRVLVVRKDPRVERPSDFLSAIYAGAFSRDRCEHLAWNSVNPLEELLLAPGALLHRKGATSEVVPLDLSADPELKQVIDELRRELAASGETAAPVSAEQSPQ